MKRFLGTLLATLAFWLPCAALAFDIPTNEGLVTDAVESGPLLTQEQKDALGDQLLSYQQSTGHAIAVWIVSRFGVEPPSFIARQIGEKWGVGSDAQQAGVLVLVAYEDGKIFIAPGNGLRSVLPEKVTTGIVEREAMPLWREGQYAQAVNAAVLAVERHLTGEYSTNRYDAPVRGTVGSWMKLVFFMGIAAAAAVLGRSGRWRLGGVVGAALGILLVVTDGWWLSIPILAAVGLLFDALATRQRLSRTRRRFA